jgi:hypothetical protein
MAKRKKKKQKKVHDVVRNWTAVAAHFSSGAGKHQDGRKKRQRTRSAQQKAAIAEYR